MEKIIVYIFLFVSVHSFAQIEKSYNKAITKADSAYNFRWLSDKPNPKDYDKYVYAKNLYIIASEISHNESYPQNRVKEIDKILNKFYARKINLVKDSLGNITESQAVKLAEDFIRYYGYTKLQYDKERFSYDSYDMTDNIDSILISRYNTLNERATFINEHNNGWDIGFLFSSINFEKLDKYHQNCNLSGRCVFVSKDGDEIYIIHKSPLFSKFKKIETNNK